MNGPTKPSTSTPDKGNPVGNVVKQIKKALTPKAAAPSGSAGTASDSASTGAQATSK